MNWTNPPGITEYILVSIFLLVYTLFIRRTFQIAKKFDARPRSLFMKTLLRSLILGLMLIALAGPFFGETERKLQILGRDIYLVVDVSKSMDATDVAPSRLEKVKYELNLMAQQLANNRMGLIAFSNEAFIQSPLTYDTEALQFMIQSLDTKLLPGQGTNVCPALQLAYEKMQRSAEVNNSKIVIVFTDGEGAANCPDRLSENLKREGFLVYFVGVGSKNGSTIPTADGVLHTEKGEMVITRLDEPALLKMANEANAQYFEISGEHIETDELVRAVKDSPTIRVDTRSTYVENNKYYYFLGIALILLAMDVLITFRTFRV